MHTQSLISLTHITLATSASYSFFFRLDNINLKPADKVLLSLAMSCTIKVCVVKVPADPEFLFQHMSITKTYEDESEKFI